MYIHYHYNNYNQTGISKSLNISSEIQKRISQKNSFTLQDTSQQTQEAAILYNLMTKNGSFEELFNDIINNINIEINDKQDYNIDLINYVTRDKLFDSIKKVTGNSDELMTYKNKLNNFLTSISSELGYSSYNDLCTTILANIAMNYGHSVDEEELIRDFISNCNNSKFNVNKEFANKLTSSLNKLFLLSKALPLIGTKGNMSYRLNTINEFVNRTIGWLNYGGGILKEIAVYKTIVIIKHDLAVALNELCNNGNKDVKIEPTGEMIDFIRENIKPVSNISAERNGIRIVANQNNFELNITVDIPNQNKSKPKPNVQKIKSINSTTTFLNNIAILEGFDTEGLMNVSGSHVFSDSEERSLTKFFNDITINIGKNLVLQELTNEKDGTFYIVNNKPYKESDIINQVVTNDGLIKIKLNFDRADIVEANEWEEGHGSTWANAYYRSDLNESYQYSNLMQYEFDIVKKFF